jgi:hypothetical protein
MFQVSIIAAIRSALVAGALLGLVAIGMTIRDAGRSESPSLTLVDDFGTRHPATAASLTLVDDFGTRHPATAASLTLVDDYGTRNQPAPVSLTLVDDYGTRHRR